MIKDFFSKLLFYISKPCSLFIIGQSDFSLFKDIGLKAKLFRLDLEDLERFDFFIKNSKKPIIIINDFEGRVITKIKKIIERIPSWGYLIVNLDNEELRNICLYSKAQCLTYGFQKRADLNATDINIDNQGTNFKADYKGSIVPFWIRRVLSKREMYSILLAVAAGLVNDMNLVEISQSLK